MLSKPNNVNESSRTNKVVWREAVRPTTSEAPWRLVNCTNIPTPPTSITALCAVTDLTTPVSDAIIELGPLISLFLSRAHQQFANHQFLAISDR